MQPAILQYIDAYHGISLDGCYRTGRGRITSETFSRILDRRWVFLAGGGGVAYGNLMLQHRTGTGIPIARKGRAGREASGFGGQGVRYTATGTSTVPF